MDQYTSDVLNKPIYFLFALAVSLATTRAQDASPFPELQLTNIDAKDTATQLALSQDMPKLDVHSAYGDRVQVETVGYRYGYAIGW